MPEEPGTPQPPRPPARPRSSEPPPPTPVGASPPPSVPPPGAPPPAGGPPPGAPPPAGGPPPGPSPAREPGGWPASGAPTNAAFGGRILPIRAMSVGDVLDGAFGGLRATFVPVALVVVAMLGPLQLVLNLALSVVAPGVMGQGVFDALEPIDEAISGSAVTAVAGVSVLAAVISFLISLVVGAATIGLLLQADRGEEPVAGDAVRGAVSVLGATLGASVLLGVGGIIAMLTLMLIAGVLGAAVPVVGPIVAVVVFLPGTVVGFAALFGVINLVVPIAVVERRGPLETLGRALWVLRRRFWRLVGITLLVGLLVVIATFGLQLPFMLLAGLLSPIGWVVRSVGEVLAQVVAVPVTAFAALLVYLDVRVRSEGLDLQLRARDLGGPGPGTW